jgi:hypothetical protein
LDEHSVRFGDISEDFQLKVVKKGKNTEGGMQLNFDKKRSERLKKLDVDKKSRIRC